MAGEPSFKTRCMAAIRGEVSARELEAVQAAGMGSYDSLARVEQTRKELVRSGAEAWDLPPATSARFLASWCAFANQRLGEKFLQADYAMDPSTVGYLPPVTARQVQIYFTEVEMWLRRASRAEADPGYRIDVPLPYPLPAWAQVEPCPMAHLHAMFGACEEMVSHAEAAVSDLHALRGEHHPDDLGRIQAELAEAKSGQSYAAALQANLHAGDASQGLHERIERSIKGAVERAYLVGQLAAMPALVKRPQCGAQGPSAGTAAPRPGRAGFDMWCLTDPVSRPAWQRDPAAVRAVEVLWANDPDPGETLRIQAQIDEGIRRGDVGRPSPSTSLPRRWPRADGSNATLSWRTSHRPPRSTTATPRWVAATDQAATRASRARAKAATAGASKLHEPNRVGDDVPGGGAPSADPDHFVVPSSERHIVKLDPLAAVDALVDPVDLFPISGPHLDASAGVVPGIAGIAHEDAILAVRRNGGPVPNRVARVLRRLGVAIVRPIPHGTPLGGPPRRVSAELRIGVVDPGRPGRWTISSDQVHVVVPVPLRTRVRMRCARNLTVTQNVFPVHGDLVLLGQVTDQRR